MVAAPGDPGEGGVNAAVRSERGACVESGGKDLESENHGLKGRFINPDHPEKTIYTATARGTEQRQKLLNTDRHRRSVRHCQALSRAAGSQYRHRCHAAVSTRGVRGVAGYARTPGAIAAGDTAVPPQRGAGRWADKRLLHGLLEHLVGNYRAAYRQIRLRCSDTIRYLVYRCIRWGRGGPGCARPLRAGGAGRPQGLELRKGRR
jgi:hypothetical protein